MEGPVRDCSLRYGRTTYGRTNCYKYITNALLPVEYRLKVRYHYGTTQSRIHITKYTRTRRRKGLTFFFCKTEPWWARFSGTTGGTWKRTSRQLAGR